MRSRGALLALTGWSRTTRPLLTTTSGGSLVVVVAKCAMAGFRTPAFQMPLELFILQLFLVRARVVVTLEHGTDVRLEEETVIQVILGTVVVVVLHYSPRHDGDVPCRLRHGDEK